MTKPRGLLLIAATLGLFVALSENAYTVGIDGASCGFFRIRVEKE